MADDVLRWLALGAMAGGVFTLVALFQKRRWRRTSRLPSVTFGTALWTGLGVTAGKGASELFEQWQAPWGQKVAAVALAAVAGLPALYLFRRWRRKVARGPTQGVLIAAVAPEPAAMAEDYPSVRVEANRTTFALAAVFCGLLGALMVVGGVLVSPLRIDIWLPGALLLVAAFWGIRQLMDPKPLLLLDHTGLWHHQHGAIAWSHQRKGAPQGPCAPQLSRITSGAS